MIASPLLLAGVLFGVAEGGVPARARSIPLEVRAPGDCPASGIVATEIDRILGTAPRRAGGTALDCAVVSAQSDRLHVRLVSSDGRIIGERVIQAAADCADRAAAAAIMIATWEADLRSPVTLGLPSVVRDEAPISAPPSPWSAALGVSGVGVASTAEAWTPGVALDAEIVHRRRWGLRSTLWGTGERSEPLAAGPGRARWARWAVGIGPRFGGDVGPVRVIVLGELALARIAVSGDGLPRTYGDASLDWGARAGLELSSAPWSAEARGPIALVVGLGAAYWPRRHQAMVAGLGETSRALPPLDALMWLGLRWEIGR
jgi:hypothetical protein